MIGNLYLHEKLKCHDIIKDSCIENINKYKMHHDPFGIVRSNQGGYHSHYFIDTEENSILNSGLIDQNWYINWITEIHAKVENFISNFNPKFKPKKYLSFWINVNYKNNYNTIHQHSSDLNNFNYQTYAYLSGVYYLKKPKDSGDLIFTPPSNMVYLNHMFNYDFSSKVRAEEGDLILFFPHENHCVEANLTNDERISIAFNMGVDHTV